MLYVRCDRCRTETVAGYTLTMTDGTVMVDTQFKLCVDCYTSAQSTVRAFIDGRDDLISRFAQVERNEKEPHTPPDMRIPHSGKAHGGRPLDLADLGESRSKKWMD